VSTLRLAELEKAILTLSTTPLRERIELLQLRPDRADVILPAAVVYAHLARQAGARDILVPGVGLREGVIADILERLTGGSRARTEARGETMEACVHLGRRFGFEEAHALHVTRLALSLFDQLVPLHGMAEEERRMLTAASVLHDVGFHVSYKGHHKHSFYLISNSEIPGFTAAQMLEIAHVARYHRKSEPSAGHESFAALAPEAQRRVSALAALLRMADALDREHLQLVHAVRAEAGEKELRLRLHGSGDFLLAAWGLQKKAGLFRRLYGREVVADFGEDRQ
jgi:exopolyphosphatase/guanosine-5'-triphosphate,3'-diphosphate pyrophosphatase